MSELPESQNVVTQLNAQIKELQDKVNSIRDSRDFQDVESVSSSRLSYVPMQPGIVSSQCGMRTATRASDLTHKIYSVNQDTFFWRLSCTDRMNHIFASGFIAWKTTCFYR